MENTPNLPQPQQPAPEFKVLTDIVKLPSRGYFYPERNAEVLVEYMTTKDEEILLSPQLVQSGKAFDTLLKRKVKDKNINPSTLLVGDQNAILMFLRITAYGPNYKVNVIDPYNSEPFEAEVNLQEIQEKELSIYPDKETLEFSYLTKDGKNNLKFKLLTVQEEQQIQKTAEAKTKATGSGISELLTERMRHQIVELDGNRDKHRIKNFIDTMAPFKAKEIRKYIDEVTPGLDMKYTFISPSTGEAFQSSFPINADFFYPES